MSLVCPSASISKYSPDSSPEQAYVHTAPYDELRQSFDTAFGTIAAGPHRHCTPLSVV